MSKTFHHLIANLEGAINDLKDEVFNSRVNLNTPELYEAYDKCKTLSFYKSQIMTDLEKAGLLVYDKPHSWEEREKTDKEIICDCINDLESLCSKDDIQNVSRADLEASVINIYEQLCKAR